MCSLARSGMALRPQVGGDEIWSAPRASSPTAAASPSLSCYLAPELELHVAPPCQSAGSRLRTCVGGRALALPPRPRATAGAAQELATGIGRLLARRRLSPQQGEGRWRQEGREMEAGRRRVMVRARRRGLPGWPVGWWEGVFGKPPRGGFCKKNTEPSIFLFFMWK